MRPTDDQPTTDPTTDRRVTVSEAATLLGLSEDAIRSRLKRGTLRKEKAPEGTVMVVLGDGDQRDRPPTDQATDHLDQALLIRRLENEVDYLRQEVEDWKEESRRKDAIIMTMAQRIPKLEPASEPREGPESTSGVADGRKVPEEESRPW